MNTLLFGGRGLSAYEKQTFKIFEDSESNKKKESKKKEEKKLKTILSYEKHKESINLINALKSLELLENEELNEEWNIITKEKYIPDKLTPSNNSYYNKCVWKEIFTKKEHMTIYIPTNSEALNECILPFGDKLLTSIHYTIIRNIGGHISFEGNIKNSKFNVHFGTHESKIRGFWNVKKTLEYLNISEKNFLNSQMAKCMIYAWIDFNGIIPSKESMKKVIN